MLSSRASASSNALPVVLALATSCAYDSAFPRSSESASSATSSGAGGSSGGAAGMGGSGSSGAGGVGRGGAGGTGGAGGEPPCVTCWEASMSMDCLDPPDLCPDSKPIVDALVACACTTCQTACGTACGDMGCEPPSECGSCITSNCNAEFQACLTDA